MRAFALAWKKRENLGASQPYAFSPPLLIDIHHCTTDLYLTHWATKGLKHIQDLFKGNVLLSFPQLQEKFNLHHTEFFTYIRVKHFISHMAYPFYTLPPKIWPFLTNPTSKLKGISFF